MENNKTIFDYLGQVFCLFGISITIMIVITMIVGDEAGEVSNMFALGSKGISLSTLLQYLWISVLQTAARAFYFTDKIIKNLSTAKRTALMLCTIVVIISTFILLFDWFPAGMWQPWAMFLLCFGVCSAVSAVIVTLKEKAENRSMQEALKKLKKGMD